MAKPSAEIIEAIRLLEEKARETRAAVIALGRAAQRLADDPNDASETWIATYTDPDVMRALGAAKTIVDSEQAWLAGFLGSTMSTMGRVDCSPSHDRLVGSVTDAVIDGCVSAALSCDCGVCVFCQIVTGIGIGTATSEIENVMRKSMHRLPHHGVRASKNEKPS